MRGELFFTVRVLLKEVGAGEPYTVVRLVRKKTILPVFIRGDAGQVVVTAVKEKSAQEEVMLRRFRPVRYIGSRNAGIRKRLPDVHPRRRAVFVGDGCFLNGLPDLLGTGIDIRSRALD